MENDHYANLLLDPESGHLWLHNYAFDEYILDVESGIVNFAKCEDMKAHIAKATYVGMTMASLDTVLVQNDEGMYSLLIPYVDSMGYGAIYRSVEPGFTFQDAFAFFNDRKFYVITQNEQNTWDTYMIDSNDDFRSRKGFLVAKNLNSGKESAQTLNDALLQIDESLSLEKLLQTTGTAGFLTSSESWRDYAGRLKDWGKTVAEISSLA